MPFDRKPCPARICCGTHDGTDRALILLRVPSFTTSFFISDDVMIDLDVKQADGMDNPFRQAVCFCQDKGSFVRIVVRNLSKSFLVTLTVGAMEGNGRGILCRQDSAVN